MSNVKMRIEEYNDDISVRISYLRNFAKCYQQDFAKTIICGPGVIPAQIFVRKRPTPEHHLGKKCFCPIKVNTIIERKLEPNSSESIE